VIAIGANRLEVVDETSLVDHRLSKLLDCQLASIPHRRAGDRTAFCCRPLWATLGKSRSVAMTRAVQRAARAKALNSWANVRG
jgi:hypothetical protein